MENKALNCPKCKSKEVTKRGFRITDNRQKIQRYHEAVYKYIEEKITDNDEFEQEILEIMGDDENLIKDTDEFSKLGQISISLSQTENNVTSEKQIELDNKNKKLENF